MYRSTRLTASSSLPMALFEEDARQFDPLTVVECQRPPSIDTTKVGGNGLMLVRKSITSMEYERVRGKNMLKIGVARE
jgi:hypothetical protein